MAYYLEVPMEDGETFLVDVTLEVEGVVPAKPGDVIGRMDETFERVLDRVQPIATAVAKRLASIPRAPDRTSVEFGISLTGKAGLVIAETTAQMHFKINLEWERPAQAATKDVHTTGDHGDI